MLLSDLSANASILMKTSLHKSTDALLRRRRIYFFLQELGWDPLKTISFVRGMSIFIVDLLKLSRQLQRESRPPRLRLSPVLSDMGKESGSTRSIYFLQDLYCSEYLLRKDVRRHLDVGSRVDGFIAQIGVQRPIDVLDIRPNILNIKNISFIQGDISEDVSAELIGQYDLVSSLHALEHVGLGRYRDRVDALGFTKAINNCRDILRVNGELLVSIPVASTSRDLIEFNSQRIFSSESVMRLLNHAFYNDSLAWWCLCDSQRRPITGQNIDELTLALNNFAGLGFLATSWIKR